MSSLNINATRKWLQEFEFHDLFIEELGWSQPANKKPIEHTIDGITLICQHIAQLGGVVVLEVVSSEGTIPVGNLRKILQKEIAKAYHENLLIFIDSKRTQSLWHWVKRESGKQFVREHYYFKGQPGDLFLAKISAMVIDIGDLDENGDIHVTEVVNRLKNALDIERVIKRFYREYTEKRLAFTELITGIKDDRDKRWYASIILNRLMFVYFLQGKGFLNKGDFKYLQTKLQENREKEGKDKFFTVFLKALFFEGFAKPETDRSKSANALLGEIKYLNGGLFLQHRIEIENKNINIPDKAFENLFNLFQTYSWNLDDTPGGKDDDINPDVLGYIFEKYINQKAFGAYYTRQEQTEYLCERTIYKLVLDKINTQGIPGSLEPVNFKSISELLMNLNAKLCKELLNDILPKLSILDPACGSGAFLVAAMKTLINLYSAVIGRIEFLNDRNLKTWLADIRKKHPSINYYIKKTIITDNLYGVDIMEEATEIAKLRLFLALVASASSVDELEPLPNIDFNIMAGNSLVGLLKVDQKTFEESGDLITQTYYHTYIERLAERNRLVDLYRHASTYAEDLRALRDDIDKKSDEVRGTLDQLLLDQFGKLKIQYQEATWDEKKNKEGKTTKRTLKISDIERLKPFHWGFEFSEIMEKRGGFDAVVTNPPWEIFKPNGKEFFEEYSDLVTKKKMSIKDFEKEQAKLLKDEEVRKVWLKYLNEYPHVSEYYRSAEQYKNQISVVNGKKTGTDINLYKLFTEQSFNLIKMGGECGIIIPSGIYTDLGAKRLREMLFEETEITSLYGLSNEKFIFEGLHHAFKFCLLTFKKGSVTTCFKAVFRINPREAVAPDKLEAFLNNADIMLSLSVAMLKRLSPDSLSVMEFKNEVDVAIAEKMLKHPLLGAEFPGKWKVDLAREFDMTIGVARKLVHSSFVKDTESLYEGKMIWQFTHKYSEPKFWINVKEIKKYLWPNKLENIELCCDCYRIVFRRQAANTNERTLVSTILPPCIHADNLASVNPLGLTGRLIDNCEQLVVVAFFNSLALDFLIRQRITTNLNFFYIYQLPMPRLTHGDKWFNEIVSRAARLICTTLEFDDLWDEVSKTIDLTPGPSPKGRGEKEGKGVTDPVERAKLRAELDGIIAHLYQLTEEEFAYILTTFPLVTQPVKDAALEQYRAFAPKSCDEEFLALIKAGESHAVEFKETARWDVKQNQPSKIMEKVIVDTAAAFLNSEGGTLLIGVKDNGDVGGLVNDYRLFGKKDGLRDAFENWLVQYLLNQYQKDIAPCLKVSFHEINGLDVCRLSISPAPRPVYVKEGNNEQFFIRTGNSKKQLSTSETVQYCKQRWPF